MTSPFRTPAWTAAPMATTSSGLTPLWASLPVSDCTRSCTAGMRVDPPTRTTWSMSDLDSPESAMAWSKGPLHRSTRSAVSSLNWARVKRDVEVLGALGRGGDEGQVDLGLLDRGQLDLGLLGGLLEPLGRHLVGGQVDALGVLERLDQPVDDLLVPVVAAQLGVARGRLDLEHAVADLEHGHVERAAAEVEDEDGLVGALLVEPVGQRGGRRLVDDAQHLEAGDGARLLGGGALGVVEVGGHGDDGLGDGVAQERLGVALQLAQDAGRDLLRRVVLAVDVDGPARAHVALDRPDGPVGVGDGLALGHLAHEDLAGLGEADHGRRGPAALGVGDDGGLAALQYGDHRVGGPQIDSYGLGHGVLPPTPHPLRVRGFVCFLSVVCSGTARSSWRPDPAGAARPAGPCLLECRAFRSTDNDSKLE